MKTTHLEDRHRDETKFSTENGISTEDEEESSTKSLLRRETIERVFLRFRISKFIASAARAFFTQRARFRTFYSHGVRALQYSYEENAHTHHKSLVVSFLSSRSRVLD